MEMELFRVVIACSFLISDVNSAAIDRTEVSATTSNFSVSRQKDSDDLLEPSFDDITSDVVESFRIIKLLVLKVNETFNDVVALVSFFGLLISYVNLFLFWDVFSLFYLMGYLIQLGIHHFVLESHGHGGANFVLETVK